MSEESQAQLQKVRIRRIIGPTPSGAAVLLGNDDKTFVVFVGFYEAAALIREINGETPARPLTHELLQNVFIGFDVDVKKVIISSIIDNTFCATLVLEQHLSGAMEDGASNRNEVRIDARPSDCLVLAMKNQVDIFVTREVFEQVQDVSKMTSDVEEMASSMSMEDMEFDLGSKIDPFDPGFGVVDPDEEFEADDDDSESEFGGGMSYRGGQ